MSGRDDWAPGDLALCIKASIITQRLPGRLAMGRTYSVADVLPACRFVDGDVDTGLVLSGVTSCNPDNCFWHGRFIKVTPPEADEFDRETITLEQRKTERVGS